MTNICPRVERTVAKGDAKDWGHVGHREFEVKDSEGLELAIRTEVRPPKRKEKDEKKVRTVARNPTHKRVKEGTACICT